MYKRFFLLSVPLFLLAACAARNGDGPEDAMNPGDADGDALADADSEHNDSDPDEDPDGDPDVETDGETFVERCDQISPAPGPMRSFYEENPTYSDEGRSNSMWDRLLTAVDDERTGRLSACADEIDAHPPALAFLVIQGDEVVLEQYFHGGRVDASNNVHSASKSVIGALIGIALDESLLTGLDQRVAGLLPSQIDTSRDARLSELDLEHLLTMTAGFQWVEDETEYVVIENQHDWVAAILGLPLVADPGATFNYNTGLTHVLSAILSAVSGGDACDFAHRRLFEPLGIDIEHWGRDPTGVYSGGYNFYITARELALFGLLYLRDGQLDGEQIVSSAWVQASLTERARDGAVWGYGFLWWTRRLAGRDVWMAWGYGGQQIFLIRDLNALVVTTTNTRDFIDSHSFHEVVGDCVIPALDP